MEILISGALLASEASGYPPENFTCNGARLVDAVDMARSDWKALFPRGNGVASISFTTNRIFDTFAAAQVAAIGSLFSAPVSGQLEIRCGVPGAALASVFFAKAVVQATGPGSTVGVSAPIGWTIQASGFSTAAPPTFTLDPDAPNTMRNKVAIPADAQSVAVVFPNDLANPVVSSLNVQRPAGLDSIGIVGVSDVTPQGFVALLSAPAPAAGYVLHWQALPGPVV